MIIKSLLVLYWLSVVAESSSEPHKDTKESQICITSAVVEGECVPYYRCTYRPSPQIDLIYRDHPCESYNNACCSTDDIIPIIDIEKREGCGWSYPGVINVSFRADDEVARFAEYPWICAILKVHSNKEAQKTYIGAGTLIHPSVVMTAAHLVSRELVSNPGLLVRCGEWDSVNEIEPFPHQEKEVADVEIHPEYNKKNLYNDIALVFLSTPMELTTHVGVACLPLPEESSTPEETLLAPVKCSVVGWDKENFGKEGRLVNLLRKVEVSPKEHDKCQNELQKTRLGRDFQLHSSFTCVEGQRCLGDGGAPLSCPIQSTSDRYMVYGVNAWSFGCDGPAVHAAVPEVRTWIDAVLGERGYNTSMYKI